MNPLFWNFHLLFLLVITMVLYGPSPAIPSTFAYMIIAYKIIIIILTFISLILNIKKKYYAWYLLSSIYTLLFISPLILDYKMPSNTMRTVEPSAVFILLAILGMGHLFVYKKKYFTYLLDNQDVVVK